MIIKSVRDQTTNQLTNIAYDILREIQVRGQELGTVTSFKYRRQFVSEEGSKPAVLIRISQAIAALMNQLANVER